MRYELSAYPTSLFEDNHILIKADKPQLSYAIDEHFNNGTSIENASDVVPCTESYIIVEGYLIRKLIWETRYMYSKISNVYANFTVRQY